MDHFNSMSGGFIPLWILGAPFLAALVSLAMTPKTRTRTDPQDTRFSQPAQPLPPISMNTGRR